MVGLVWYVWFGRFGMLGLVWYCPRVICEGQVKPLASALWKIYVRVVVVIVVVIVTGGKQS